MKTIDFLVQELPKCGGWPEGAIGAGFLGYEGTLYFWDGDDCCPPKWNLDVWEETEDPESEVSREQYEAALAAKNDGWIEWGGGKHPPVSTNTVVDVKFKNGNAQSGYPAGEYSWEHVWQDCNIIAYRLHKPTKSEQVRAAAWNSYAGITMADDEADLNECIGQDATPVWNGEGKPTVGTKCEHRPGGQWEVVTIAGIYENIVTGFTDYWMVKEDGSSYTVGNPYRFRPIRSEADKKRDDMANAIDGFISGFKSEKIGSNKKLAYALTDYLALLDKL